MTERQERFSVEEILFSWQKGPFPCDAGRTGQVLLHDPGLSHGRRRKVWADNGQAPVLFEEFKKDINMPVSVMTHTHAHTHTHTCTRARAP